MGDLGGGKLTSEQWVLKPENSLLWHKTVLDWINHYSGIATEQEEERRNMPGPVKGTPAAVSVQEVNGAEGPSSGRLGERLTMTTGKLNLGHD